MITNQARRRPAELVGIVSVTEDWTVARHRALAEEIIAKEAELRPRRGNGNVPECDPARYPLAPKVSTELRRQAQQAAEGEPNPRRAARARELELAGAPGRGSIWEETFATTPPSSTCVPRGPPSTPP